MNRMRLVGWQVLPIVMADDGENLNPVQVGPQMIPAAQWSAFKNGGDDQALAALRTQVEGVQFTEPEQPSSTSTATRTAD